MDVTTAVTAVTLGFIALLGVAVIWQIFTGKIDLSRLISEPSGDASMSRLQLLIFTFVIALSLFLVIANSTEPGFPEISGGVLTLLGISASSYLVSKGIQFSNPEGVEEKPPTVKVTPASVTLAPGQSQTFKAQVSRTQNKAVEWALLPSNGAGQIDKQTGVYTAPTGVPPAGLTVTVTAVSVADPNATDSSRVRVEP
jgi:hypothetical protein